MHNKNSLGILKFLPDDKFFSMGVSHGDYVLSLCVIQVQHLGWLLLGLPLSGLLAFAQNFVAFTVISIVSPVSYSVANVTKRIVVISTSLFLLQNPVTHYNMCGMAMAVTGVALYNWVSGNY